MPTRLSSTPDVDIERQERPWSGRAAMDLIQFRRRRFDGTLSPSSTWEVLRRGTAAAVLPYDPWTDQVVLVEQFRIAAFAAGLDPVMVEIPAGLTDEGETAEHTARREAEEEAHLRTDLMARIGDVLLAAGSSDERITLFAGRVHAPSAGPDGIAGFGGLQTEGEDIRIRVRPALSAIEDAVAGRYPNSVTAIALLWLAARRDTLRAEWLA